MTVVDQARPRLLFFYSPTEGSSRRVEGFIAQVLQRRRNHDTFHIRRIDVSVWPDIAQRFGVKETPSIYVVDGNKVVSRTSRPRGSKELAELLRPWLR